MTEKERYDALHTLAELAWRDWDHKARYQWKLAFAIWGAALAATSLKVTASVNISIGAAWIIAIGVSLIHWYFLGWIENRIRELRRQMQQYMLPMEKLVGVQSDELKRFAEILETDSKLTEERRTCRKIWYRIFIPFCKPAAMVHLLITLVVVALFVLSVQLALEKSESTSEVVSRSVLSDSTAVNAPSQVVSEPVLIDTTATIDSKMRP